MSCCGVFAEYKPIPEHLCSQYKQEMEQIINEEYPKVIDDIDNIVIYAKNLKDNILKNGFNDKDYVDLALIPRAYIPSTDLYLYSKLLKVTKEKYLGEKYIPLGTDSVNPIDNILSPYFNNNNVNRDKLTKIIHHQHEQIEIVEKYVKEVEVYCK